MIHWKVKQFRKNIMFRVPYGCRVSHGELGESAYWEEYYKVTPKPGFRIFKNNKRSYAEKHFAARYDRRERLEMRKS